MIIGLPNTGKSTIINQLANRAAARTADRPGHTQVQQWIVIDKDLELLDTPGVMPTSLESDEHGLWLSAIHAIPDDLVGEEMPAKFLVDYFKERKSKELKERYKLTSLDFTTEEIMEKIAVLRGCVKQKGLPDLERVYKLILLDFRKGELGKCCFGTPPT
jgi:ribosome biogenesis GTPase A